MESAYYARLRRRLILREKRNKNSSTNFNRRSTTEFRLNRRMILNRKRNVSSVTNNIANGVVSWSVLPRTTIPDAELFPSESNEFLTSGGKSRAKDVETFERRTRLRQHDPSGESISPLVNIMAETNIDEDGNITEQHMPLQEGAIHFTTRRDFPRTNEGESSTMTSTNVEDNICNRSERVSNGPRRKQRKFTEPLNFGPPTQVCEHCGAQLWYEERTLKSKKPKKPKFSLCCSEGRIQLPILKDPPPFLERLLNLNNDQRSMKFRLGIRIYNSLFAFTSLGGSVDNSVNNGSAPYVFRLNGQNHHRIGSLIPVDGQRPKFAQLYIYDTENEVTNRIGSIIGDNSRNTVDQDIVAGLLEMLDQCNSDGRQYNFPTTSEVAAIIVGDFNIESCNRDIIVENRSLGLQRINGSHPSFMALQYPLLFPYGEDGYMFGIPYRNLVGGNSRKRESVTMREYYAYRLQQRSHDGTTLLLGGRLFQQFIVDAYTCIEEERLQWVRRNQKKLRSELYSGLKDAILRGDTNPITVGKRIILPSSFTGSPRYMVQNYQDAMAICRSAGYPDLFITFTCNPKWPEIALFLESIEGQKVEDRPDIVARIFRIKLDELLHDLRNKSHFGRVIAIVYTIEFQKRGLPHAHILLFLDPNDKCPSSTDFCFQCYMSAASNDDLSNLSSEGDDDYAKLQRSDNANDTQLTTTSTITENERNYSLTNAEQKKKKQRIV